MGTPQSAPTRGGGGLAKSREWWAEARPRAPPLARGEGEGDPWQGGESGQGGRGLHREEAFVVL